jgi:hypothetical protein
MIQVVSHLSHKEVNQEVARDLSPTWGLIVGTQFLRRGCQMATAVDKSSESQHSCHEGDHRQKQFALPEGEVEIG